MSVITGNPVHAVALLPGDVVHRETHLVHGTDTEGHDWGRIVLCEPADVRVERVRVEGPDLVALYWWLGAACGVTVYGRTALVPLLERVA